MPGMRQGTASHPCSGSPAAFCKNRQAFWPWQATTWMFPSHHHSLLLPPPTTGSSKTTPVLDKVKAIRLGGCGTPGVFLPRSGQPAEGSRGPAPAMIAGQDSWVDRQSQARPPWSWPGGSSSERRQCWSWSDRHGPDLTLRRLPPIVPVPGLRHRHPEARGRLSGLPRSGRSRT